MFRPKIRNNIATDFRKIQEIMFRCRAVEQLEEGEIIDDDDLEQISDNSIVDDYCFPGKSVSNKERLRALSLSSISDASAQKPLKRFKRKRRVPQRRPKKRCKLHAAPAAAAAAATPATVDSSDSEGYVELPKELKGQLKEAIHFNDEHCEKNSLENRLKRMGNLVAEAPDIAQVDCAVPEKLDESAGDKELEDLRLEALKTAILNKKEKRKKKLTGEQVTLTNGISAQAQTDDKENADSVAVAKDTTEDNPKRPCLEQNGTDANKQQNDNDELEDEDILRAAVLTSLAKKITNQPMNSTKAKPSPKLNTVVSKTKILSKPAIKIPAPSKFSLNNLRKPPLGRTAQKQTTKDVAKMPPVKPLIINLNTDSDSDGDNRSKPNQTVTVVNKTPTNIDKFLKEQRAKVEMQKKIAAQKSPAVLEKSAVKLLPKLQQIEYRSLLRKLKLAELNNRRLFCRKRLATTTIEGASKQAAVIAAPSATTSVTSVSSAIVVNKLQEKVQSDSVDAVGMANNDGSICSALAVTTVTASTNETVTAASCTAVATATTGGSPDAPARVVQAKPDVDDAYKVIETDKRNSNVISELTTLKRTLKEIRMSRDKSLQMKAKYQVLRPIMKRITQASNQRKLYECRIKGLLDELNCIRGDMLKSQEQFSSLVQELVKRKEEIDKSCDTDKTSPSKENNHYDSLPPVQAATFPESIRDLSCDDNGTCKSYDVADASPDKNIEIEDMDLCNSTSEEMEDIDIMDPNDIDQIFPRRQRVVATTNVETAIPDYVSPLNNQRYVKVDPYGIMCPYEVNGSCRDDDCTFKHYMKT